jgi:hypothetical protein
MNFNDRILEADFISDGRGTLPTNPDREWPARDPEKLQGVCYHQSLEEHGRAAGNARYHAGPNHISRNGLPGLSYTLFVEQSGEVILANDVECKTFSQGYRDRKGDENALYIGVCFGGNFSGPGYKGTQHPTPAQMRTAVNLWRHLKSIWDWNDEALYGHFDFGKPACPGDALMNLIWMNRPTRFYSVVEKQKALSWDGFYKGEIDGIWGPLSKAALVKFQESAGLEPTGVWDFDTSLAMRGHLEGD